jgi:hypothetical protein
MAKIYAPNKQYTGVSASVPFVNGVGETADPHLIDWFRTHGYTVEKAPGTPKEPKTSKEPGGSGEKKPDGGGE